MMNKKNNILPGFLLGNSMPLNVMQIITINDLIKKSIGDTKKICAICFNYCCFQSRPNVCRHSFCYNCLKIWSRQKKICPLCRRVFSNIIKD